MSDFKLMPGHSVADSISLIDFADSFAAKVNSFDVPGIHPSGAAIVWEYLCDMRAAAEQGQAKAVAHLVRRVNEKIAQEHAWEAEKLRRIEAFEAPHA